MCRQAHSAGSERHVVLGGQESGNHFLGAGLVELDLDLVALDPDHAAIAEFLVEHPLAQREAGQRGGSNAAKSLDWQRYKHRRDGMHCRCHCAIGGIAGHSRHHFLQDYYFAKQALEA